MPIKSACDIRNDQGPMASPVLASACTIFTIPLHKSIMTKQMLTVARFTKSKYYVT